MLDTAINIDLSPKLLSTLERKIVNLRYMFIKQNNHTTNLTGAPCQIRTGDLLIRTQMLYPTELMALKKSSHLGKYEDIKL